VDKHSPKLFLPFSCRENFWGSAQNVVVTSSVSSRGTDDRGNTLDDKRGFKSYQGSRLSSASVLLEPEASTSPAPPSIYSQSPRGTSPCLSRRQPRWQPR
jgi:hypothetical protein